MTFTYQLPISFHLTDAGGILFYSHVFTLAHQAYEQFVTQKLGYSWNDWFQNAQWTVPLKHAEATYHSPLYVGRQCVIEVEILEVSTSSFVLVSRFNQAQDECCAVTKTVHVFCDRIHFQKCPIPPPIRQLLINCKSP